MVTSGRISNQNQIQLDIQYITDGASCRSVAAAVCSNTLLLILLPHGNPTVQCRPHHTEARHENLCPHALGSLERGHSSACLREGLKSLLLTAPTLPSLYGSTNTQFQMESIGRVTIKKFQYTIGKN